MNKCYRLKLEQMLKNKELNKELLINCICKINPKIERVNTYIYRIKNYYSDGLTTAAKDEIKNHKEDFNRWIDYRKPILDLVMYGYKLSLNVVKQLVKEADKNNLPTFKMIDTIRTMIINYDFKLI